MLLDMINIGVREKGGERKEIRSVECLVHREVLFVLKPVHRCLTDMEVQ